MSRLIAAVTLVLAFGHNGNAESLCPDFKTCLQSCTELQNNLQMLSPVKFVTNHQPTPAGFNPGPGDLWCIGVAFVDAELTLISMDKRGDGTIFLEFYHRGPRYKLNLETGKFEVNRPGFAGDSTR